MSTKPADPPTILTDAELAIRVGDRVDRIGADEAFQALIQRHAPGLLAYLAARVNPSDAEDIRQETWVRIWIALGERGRFDGKNFRAWAFEIARNLIIDRQRRHKLKTTSLQGNGQGNPIDAIDHRGATDPFAEHREALARCLERLSHDERAVFTSHCDGVKSGAMAERANVSAERIYKLLNRARAKLTACLEGSVS